MSDEAAATLDVVDGAVALVTLNRPAKGNSVNAAMADDLNAIWEEVRSRRDVRSVVLTGAGDRFFCTGVDLEFNNARAETAGHVWPDIVELWKPVIVAVNGICSGGGLHFIYQSDFAIGARTATFFEPHVSVGLVPVREILGLATRMPFGAVARMALTGRSERLGADDALRLGILTEVVEPEALLDRTLEVARSINEQSPAAVAAIKEILHKSRGLMYEYHQEVKWAHSIRDRVHEGPDYREGQRAFLEKRPPRWAEPGD